MAAMAALKPLIGRWSTTITMITSAEEAGKTYRAIDTYRWMPGEKVLVHEVEARMGDDTINSLEIYTEADGEIVSRSFDSSGEITDYAAAMKEGGWTVLGNTERFKSTSVANDRIEGLWERRLDGDWTDWMKVRLDRIA